MEAPIITDIHTHLPGNPHALCSGEPQEVAQWLEEYPEGVFSAGIHPWHTAEDADPERIKAQLHQLEALARHPRVLAIGECGLDSLRGAPLHRQQEIFLAQLRIALSVGKPLILHVVRQQNAVLTLLRKYAPGHPCIWHAYRGAPSRAAEILSASPNHFLSFGQRFNPATVSLTPLNRLLTETDTTAANPLSISDILTPISNLLSLTPEALSANTASIAAAILEANLGE